MKIQSFTTIPSIKISTMLFMLLCTSACLFFIFAINDSYYNQDVFSIGADSSTYYKLAQLYDLSSIELVTLGSNFLGPMLILKFTDMNNYFVFTINLLFFTISYICINKYYYIRRYRFLFFLCINPMLLASLLLVNKEIIGLFSMALFACYLVNKSKRYLWMALLFGLLTRWQQSFVFLVFIMLNSKLNPLKHYRKLTLLALVLSLSVLYPPFLSSTLGTVGDAETLARQSDTAGGFAQLLNRLQDHYLFFVAVIPKIFSNLFGNIFRIKNYILAPSDIDLYDIYNSFIVLGHQIAMFIVTILLIYKKKLKLSSDIIYFSTLYLIVYSLSTMIQYRYIYPIYILICLNLCLCNKEASECK